MKSNNIVLVSRRMELYLDFIINITYKIHETHPGFDCLYEKKDISNHFKYCFNCICEQHLEQGVDFRDNNDLYEFLYDSLYKVLYSKNKLKPISYYLLYWNKIFTNKSPKNMGFISNIYDFFDKSIVK